MWSETKLNIFLKIMWPLVASRFGHFNLRKEFPVHKTPEWFLTFFVEGNLLLVLPGYERQTLHLVSFSTHWNKMAPSFMSYKKQRAQTELRYVTRWVNVQFGM